MGERDERVWVAAHEGYYGPPLTHAQRLDLIRWAGANGLDGYAYAPKDDDLNRARWRDPYPPEAMARFAELHEACEGAAIDLVVMLSPGLDWRAGDPTEVEAVAAKLEAFAGLGVSSFAVNWDDVPGRGAEAGAEHGGAVAAVVERVDVAAGRTLTWLTCPVDYAVAAPTPYLAAFAAALPAEVAVAWTGPSVLTRTLAAPELHGIEAALGHPVAFCENFPVNDLGMSGVLHLGPYPSRDPALVGGSRRVFVNLMDRVEASRVALVQAERFWHGGGGVWQQDAPRSTRSRSGRVEDDPRHDAWLDAVRRFAGLEPLARSCWSWVADPEPEPDLVAWATAALDGDDRLADFLRAGCRDGLAPSLAAEVEPWLDQWEVEATAMLAALDLLAAARPPTIPALWAAAQQWDHARAGRCQVFGIRFARYPMTRHDGSRLLAERGAVVHGTNLTDRLWAAALDQLGC